MSVVKTPTRKQTNESRARQSTCVYPPVLVPWRAPDNLRVSHPVQLKTLRVVARKVHTHGKARVHVLLVHGTSCDLTVTLWPLEARDDHDKVRANIERMRADCKCDPLVMYTGASA